MPPAVKNLIIINVLFFIGSIVLKSAFGIQIEKFLGLHIPIAGDFKFYQFVTYMFLHAYPSPHHIFFNMFALFMFGRSLETIWGAKRFILFYFVTGIGAGVIQEITWIFELRNILFSDYEWINLNGKELITKADFINRHVTVGASGAVFGILLAFGMMFPNALIYVYFLMPIKAKWLVIIYGALELWMGVSGTADGVAHFAHLGGMLFGFFLIRKWKRKGKIY